MGTDVNLMEYFSYVTNPETERTIFRGTVNIAPCDKYRTLEELLEGLGAVLAKHKIEGVNTDFGFVSYKLSEIVRAQAPPTMTDEEYLLMLSQNEQVAEG